MFCMNFFLCKLIDITHTHVIRCYNRVQNTHANTHFCNRMDVMMYQFILRMRKEEEEEEAN